MLERPLRCAGKTRHETPKAAAVELKKRKGRGMVVYKCDHCYHYHIGHRVGSNLKNPRKEKPPERKTPGKKNPKLPIDNL